MRTALVTAAVLLVLSIGMARLHIEPRVHLGLLSLVGVAIVTALFLFFGHIELALAAITPVALTFTAMLGMLGWLGARIHQFDAAFILILLLPAMSLSLICLGFATRIYRGDVLSARWMMPLVLATAIVAATSDWLLARRFGAVSNLVGGSGLIGLCAGWIAVLLILRPVADFLMPHDRNRAAPAFRISRAMDSRMRVRALYRYLDIPAEQYVIWKLRLDPMFSRFEKSVPSSGAILDAGCGFGIMSNLLAMQSASRTVIGIDQDERKLRIARRAARTLRNVHYVSADLLNTDYPPADCVLLIDALHYWSAEKQAQIIARCAACLRPGGLVIFREGMRDESAGHRVVHWAERGAVWLGHNPRGEGLHFQQRDFYLREFARHGLDVEREPTGWGRGSNTVLILKDGRPSQHEAC